MTPSSNRLAFLLVLALLAAAGLAAGAYADDHGGSGGGSDDTTTEVQTETERGQTTTAPAVSVAPVVAQTPTTQATRTPAPRTASARTPARRSVVHHRATSASAPAPRPPVHHRAVGHPQRVRENHTRLPRVQHHARHAHTNRAQAPDPVVVTAGDHPRDRAILFLDPTLARWVAIVAGALLVAVVALLAAGVWAKRRVVDY